MFYTNRTGWPINIDIESKINQGATHYVSTSFDDVTNNLATRYQTIQKTDEFILLDLTKPLEQ